MRDSKVYLAAVRLVAERGYASCYAVNKIVCGNYMENTGCSIDYAALFAPKNPDWAWGERWSNDLVERKDCRILALLFMSAIAADEEQSQKNTRKRSRK